MRLRWLSTDDGSGCFYRRGGGAVQQQGTANDQAQIRMLRPRRPSPPAVGALVMMALIPPAAKSYSSAMQATFSS
jgi:hypothetical protein